MKTLAAFFILASSLAARAVILFGDPPTTVNTTDPGTGVPWKNVVAIGTNNASGVYLGNRFVLTANHVYLHPNNDPAQPYYPVLLNGSSYTIDSTFAPLQISPADLKIFRLTAAPPGSQGIASVSLTSVLDDESLPGTYIGYGKGKGAPITGGWAWESDSSWQTNFVERWGTSQMIGALTDSGVNYLYDAFDASAGSNQAAIALGDSGSGFFISYSGLWKLVAVPAAVTEFGQTRYDNDPGTAGNQPDNSFSVRISSYSWQMRFDDWRVYYSVSPGTLPTEDTDADGLPLLLEYAFGGTPTGNDAALQPQFSSTSSTASLTFYQRMSATDLTFILESSPDLGTWTTVASPTQQVLFSSGLVWQMKDTVPLNGATRLFLRLRVTLTP